MYGAGAIAVVSNGKTMGLSCRPGRGATEWSCELPERPECGTEKEVAISGAVADISGNLAGQGVIGRFWTSCNDDLSVPALEMAVVSMAPQGFSVRWKASEPCMFSWELHESSSGDVLDDGISASVAAEWIAGYDVPLSDRDYVLSGGCTDAAGNHSGPVIVPILHGELPPSVAVNEVMPNPSGADTGAEFVELYNYGTEAVDLRGWKISRCAEPSKALELSPGTGFALSPGQFALVVSDMDKGSLYPWDAKLIRLAGGPVPGGLSNSHPEEICILDSGGAVVSSFGGWLVPGEGISAERVSSGRPDCRDNWAASSKKGGTPGASNSVKL